MKPILNIAAYQFLPLSDLKALRTRLQALCKSASLKGTILLSPEGINLFVAGPAQGIGQLLTELRSRPGRSYAPRQAAKTALFAAVNEATVPKKAPQATFFP